MLVLSRKKRESVVVGGDDVLHRLFKITVLEVGNGTVKLGFEVDSTVPVHRLEVWERMRANDVLPCAPTGPVSGSLGMPNL